MMAMNNGVMNDGLLIFSQNTDVTGDGVEDTVFLTGSKRADSDIFFENITLHVTIGGSGQTISQSLGPDNAGYNPRFALCDFNKDGVLDILTSIDFGGSGAFVFNRLYTARGGHFQSLFNVAEFNERFRGQVVYLNNYRVEITVPALDKTYFIDVSDRKELYQGRIYGPDGQLLEPTTGIVSDLNVLYPTQEGANCGLLALQRVTGLFSADGFGYLETMFTWEGQGFVPISQTLRQV